MIYNENDFNNFLEDVKEMSGSAIDDYAVELITMIENSNLDITNYGSLFTYSISMGLLNDNLKLHEDLKISNVEYQLDLEELHSLEEEELLTESSAIESLNEAQKVVSKRDQITNKLLKYINILDETGLNGKKYKNLLESMSDVEFSKYMNNFCSDPEENIYLEILPNKNEPRMDQIEKVLDILKIPTDEYVYYRHDGYKENPIRTAHKVPVGPINVRRLQQTLSKKNTYSLNIDNRSSKTGQVQADDKIARVSDSELYALTIFGADKAIEEFYGPRSDNMSKKRDMYSKISKYGYVYLDELEDNIADRTTLNTINTFLLGAGLFSDLIDDTKKQAERELTKTVIEDIQKNIRLEENELESLVPRNYKFIYVPLTDSDVKRGRIQYEATDKFNGKYVNTTLEGLESFVAVQRITKEMTHYAKVNIEDVKPMVFDEETNGAIIQLPIDIPITNLQPLDIRIENRSDK